MDCNSRDIWGAGAATGLETEWLPFNRTAKLLQNPGMFRAQVLPFTNLWIPVYCTIIRLQLAVG